jgi:regulatory protein
MKTRKRFRNYARTPVPPFDRALKYLSIRQRSIKEINDYLEKKQYPKDDINEAIKKLIELKFLNDDDFARTFTENRQRKGKSKKLISYELGMKGISKNTTNDVLEYAKNDYKTALEYLSKRLKQFDRYEPEEKQKKIISRLRSRGYNWDTISKVLKKVDKENPS